MVNHTIVVPDIGGAEGAEVVELLVAVGDAIELEQSLIVLESDKASMEIPASHAGVVAELKVAVGDQISEGDAVLILEIDDEAPNDGAPIEQKVSEPSPQSTEPDALSEPEPVVTAVRVSDQIVEVPDIGTDGPVDVVEVCITQGDILQEGDSIVVLESDKASMEVPAPFTGEVLELLITNGASVSQGTALLRMRTAAQSADAQEPSAAPAAPIEAAPEPMPPTSPSKTEQREPPVTAGHDLYVGPAVRKLAREFGVDLLEVQGSGPKGRIIKEDVQKYVAMRLAQRNAAASTAGGIPLVADVDFSKFGPVRRHERSRIDKVTAANMSKSWLNVPHVTQFDDADITDLEDFRKSLKAEAERRGSKLSPVPFIVKAVAIALNENPKLKTSLSEQGEALIYKDYCHIGLAVDTPNGLVVPVLRDADKKSIWVLSDEIRELAGKAKDKKLKPDEMQGAVFTISSLGSIGGRGFTPIVNAPEVAILGVSNASTQPVWDGSTFEPRIMLPVSMSYDHRVVNGGDAGRFLTQLVALLGDIRQLAMR
ncbi:MAG: dihydrolipoyllysine-residue acetyltransferase [Luminiphilus sp.]|nr:dihydrolipoyllysine-residue acetyltransferase [Luminiphilus sp.]